MSKIPETALTGRFACAQLISTGNTRDTPARAQCALRSRLYVERLKLKSEIILIALLTDSGIKAVKPGSTIRDIYDGGAAGLCLRVFPSGRKAWGLRIRIAGKQRRFDLGDYPAKTLADARDLARAMKKAAARGEDPSNVLRPPPSDVPTMAAAIAVYMETKLDNRSHDMEQRRFALHVEPVLGAKQVDKVRKADIDELLHAMVKRGMRAEPNRVFTSDPDEVARGAAEMAARETRAAQRSQ